MDVNKVLQQIVYNNEDDDDQITSDSDENEENNRSKVINGDESDISIPSEESESESEDEMIQTQDTGDSWSKQLKKPKIPCVFEEEVGAIFELGPQKKEIDFFSKFFTTSIVEKLVTETNSYAEKMNSVAAKPDKKWVPTFVQEMMAFLGIHESPNHQIKTKKGKSIKKTQLQFRMALAQQMIGGYRGSRKRKIPSVVDNCGSAHWPIQFPKPSRCKGCTKAGRRHEVSIGCRECNITLCIKHDCFYKYHKEMLG
ncbi:hypothetical protein KUTeg_005711 [Tegillarca granosa]|uniref:PiggyBac transposable element-derived protein domain-containing protein n=1 Tax=Tegillarca granosa TaxID=220873 RepID=A0ABQ9FKI8_TEGGR|nr:hypothetical protein KUTeg_005711 [Tegillarca granosa]